MKITTKQLVQTALLLALCIASQFFKNLSVYITGPIVNTIIIIAVLAVSLYAGLLISIIAPITAFLITGSPLMATIPWMIPAVMAGNCILAVSVWAFQTKTKFSWRLPAGMVVGSIVKALFMGIVIVGILFQVYAAPLAEKIPKPAVIEAAKVTFSVTQLVTALIGSLLAYLIWIPLKKYLKNEEA